MRQYEALQFERFEMNVLVRNESYTKPKDNAPFQTTEDDRPISCACPADDHSVTACNYVGVTASRSYLVARDRTVSEVTERKSGVFIHAR